MYWAEIGTSRGIQRITAEGMSEVIVSLQSTLTVRGLAFLGEELYWTDSGSNEGGRVIKSSAPNQPLATGLSDMSGLVAVSSLTNLSEFQNIIV